MVARAARSTACISRSWSTAPRAVSHPGSGWGLPVDVPGYTDHVVHVWFEMAAGYLATAAEWAGGDWRQAWQDGATVQFFGYDNGHFHAGAHLTVACDRADRPQWT